VKPCDEEQTFEEFIDFVSMQGVKVASSLTHSEMEIRYAQTREFAQRTS
jgi:hypothetical protein